MYPVRDQYDHTTPYTEMTGQTLLAQLWHRRISFLVVFFVVFAVVMAALVLLPKSYVATGSVIVAEPETALAVQSGDRSLTVGDPADVESQLLVIRSDRILKLVAAAPDSMDLIRRDCETSDWSHADCLTLAPDNDNTVEYLSKRYSIAGVGRSRVINISYKSLSPQIAHDMANSLITTYLDDHKRHLATGRNTAGIEIQRQLDELDQDIRSLDNNIQAFREKNGLIQGSQAPISTELLSSLIQQLASAQSARSQAASALDEVQSDLNSDIPTSPLVLASPSVKAIQTRMLALSTQIEVASVSFGPKHPQIQVLTSELASLRTKLKVEVQNFANVMRKQLLTEEERIKRLQALVKNAQEDVNKANANESTIAQLVSGVEVKRKEYADLSSKLRTIEIEQQSILGSTRLVSLATLPIKAVFPKTLPFVVGGFFLAALLATGVALAIERFLGGTSLGRRHPTLPQSRQKVPDDSGIPVNANAPADRILPVWNLESLPPLGAEMKDAQKQIFIQILQKLDDGHAMTSRGSAKSLVIAPLSREALGSTARAAAHLAGFAASFDMKPLLVEVNFEEPVLADVMDLNPQRSLNDLLDVSRMQILSGLYDIAVPVHDIDVVCSVPVGRDVADSYLNGRLSGILTNTSGYDLVIFICPEFIGNLTAGFVGHHVRGLLLCEQTLDEDASLTSEIFRRLKHTDLRVLGTLIARTHKGRFSGALPRLPECAR